MYISQYIVLRYGIPHAVNQIQTSASATEFNMLRPTIQHRTVQPLDSGPLAPPTEPTESRGGRLSIPNHKYHKLYNIPHFLTTDTTTSSMRRAD